MQVLIMQSMLFYNLNSMYQIIKYTHLVWAWHKVLMTTDLPPPVGPTTIVVCRVNIVSYI